MKHHARRFRPWRREETKHTNPHPAVTPQRAKMGGGRLRKRFFISFAWKRRRILKKRSVPDYARGRAGLLSNGLHTCRSPYFAHTCGGLSVCTLIFMAEEYFAHGAGPFQGLAFWIQKPLQFRAYVRGLSLRQRAFINPRKHTSWNPSPSLRRRAFNISCRTNGICRQASASAHGIASKEKDIPRKAARPATGAPYGGEA